MHAYYAQTQIEVPHLLLMRPLINPTPAWTSRHGKHVNVYADARMIGGLCDHATSACCAVHIRHTTMWLHVVCSPPWCMCGCGWGWGWGWGYGCMYMPTGQMILRWLEDVHIEPRHHAHTYTHTIGCCAWRMDIHKQHWHVSYVLCRRLVQPRQSSSVLSHHPLPPHPRPCAAACLPGVALTAAVPRGVQQRQPAGRPLQGHLHRLLPQDQQAGAILRHLRLPRWPQAWPEEQQATQGHLPQEGLPLWGGCIRLQQPEAQVCGAWQG
jgi:hypothetical protein